MKWPFENSNLAPASSRRRPVLPLLLAVLLSLCARESFAQSPASRFDAANKLYEQGKFNEAASAYEAIVRAGKVSEPIYFNWGNALFKAGKLGQAIAAYQQAEHLAPRDPDVRANLQFARNQVQGPTFLPDRASRWLGKLSVNEWTWLAAAALWMWLLLLTLMQWRPAWRPALKSYAICVGALAGVICLCFGAAFNFSQFAQRAIIVASEATARQAPFEEAQSAFTLHDGAELRVIDQKDQWLQVRADPRRIGWVRKDSVLVTPAG